MNKRILICVLTIIWSTTLIHAERVSVDRARKVAENVLSESNNNVSRSPGLNGTAKKISPVLTFTRYATDGSMQTPSVYTTEPTPLYYIFNNGDNEGFVIVSADDNVTPVLGYSDTGNFTNVGIPQNIDNWFNGYARDISVIIENKIEATEDIKAKWANYEAGTASGSTANEVLLKTVNWSQGEPYNNLCPLYQSERTPTGCVATSMAIIMKYHCWPERAIGSGSYYRPGGSNVLNLVNFGSEYNWDLMLDYYYTDYYGNPEYTEDQAKAIATLMLHCGASVHMNYNISGSAARTSDCVTAFKNNFSYSEDVESLAFEESDPNTWMAIIKNNINNNRPIIYSGNSEDVGGHAFILDGYDKNDYVHINWGWGGSRNGYFTISEMNPGYETGFTRYQGMVYNIYNPQSTPKTSISYESGIGFEIIPVSPVSSGQIEIGSDFRFIVDRDPFFNNYDFRVYVNDQLLNSSDDDIYTISSITSPVIIKCKYELKNGFDRKLLIECLHQYNLNYYDYYIDTDNGLIDNTENTEMIIMLLGGNASTNEYFIDELNDLRKLMTEEYSGLYYTDAYAFSRIASITSEKHVCQVNFNLTSIKKGIEDLTQMKSPASISMTGVATSALEKVTINIKGEVLPQYLDKNETKLNVFVVEDNVTIDGYSIRNLARSMETPLWGDDISFDGNTFEKSYTISLDNCENKDNVKIIAYISRFGPTVWDREVYNTTSISIKEIPKMNSYAVNLSSNLEKAEISGGGINIAGTDITIAVNPVYGYDFKGWYNGNQLISSNLTYTFKLSSDCSFVAIFEETEMPDLVAGKLSEMILPGNIGSVTDLKLNGEMNWLDFMYIKNNLTALQELDISNVKIVGYYDEQTGVTYYEDQIPDNALNNYTVLENLHTIILPENITIIGRQSFDGLRNLSSINLPNSVREILYYAFGYNNITDEIRLPDNLQRIQSYIFAGNKTKGFTISDKNDNFTTENGFLYDKSKMILYISPGQAESRIYRAPKELIYLQPWGFSDMDYDLFDASECSKLKNLPIYFFLSSKIKKVILPEINYVGDNAFQNTQIDTLVIRSSTPPTVDTKLCENSIYGTTVLCVPEGSSYYYKNADHWSNFNTISEEKIGTSVNSIMDEKDVYQIANGAINLKENIKADIRIFDIRGRLISELKDVSGTVILNIPDEKLLFINISNNDFNITEKLIR